MSPAKNDLVFCHATAEFTRNIGDVVSCPKLYFTEYADAYELDYVYRPNAPVIFGGGGFFDNIYDVMIGAKGEPVIVWGMGTNIHPYSRPPHYLREFDKFALFGCRDFGSPYRYVPCPSCLSPLFDRFASVQPAHEVVVYEGWMEPLYTKYPTLANHARNTLPLCLRHIASGATVITNSYHGVYWAQLLGRKCACLNVDFNKFRTLKHSVPNATKINDAIRLAAQAPIGYLAECRKLNQDFHQEVKATLLKHGVPLRT